MKIPYFRPDVSEDDIVEVVTTLRSGWLTTGPRVRAFEEQFAAAVNGKHAVAVNSCTAALHLAVESLGLATGQAVLVPTMTFAATAEVVRYQGAVPILVDCDPVTLNMDLEDAALKLQQMRTDHLPANINARLPVIGIIPVHVGGQMMDVGAVQRFASQHGLWIVEDAAHAFPAAWRNTENDKWQRCGEATASVSCFSFYANKTITTGEGGMAVTNNDSIAERMKLMSLHGLSHDAWGRYSEQGSWDYKIIAPGFKYNLTDLAASIGIHQLERAKNMRMKREAIAHRYFELLADVEQIEMPTVDSNRSNSWHLFIIRLRLDRVRTTRSEFINQLGKRGVNCSVHWRPLHLHPYYRDTFGWRAEAFPTATREWERLISLPIFPGMSKSEIEYVAATVKDVCAASSLSRSVPSHDRPVVRTSALV